VTSSLASAVLRPLSIDCVEVGDLVT
jgi:hypothetical protein